MDAIRTVIEPCETALRAAMLANDVEALEALLDDDLVFTVPTDQWILVDRHPDGCSFIPIIWAGVSLVRCGKQFGLRPPREESKAL